MNERDWEERRKGKQGLASFFILVGFALFITATITSSYEIPTKLVILGLILTFYGLCIKKSIRK